MGRIHIPQICVTANRLLPHGRRVMFKQKRCSDKFVAKGVLLAVEEDIRESYAIRGIVSGPPGQCKFSSHEKLGLKWFNWVIVCIFSSRELKKFPKMVCHALAGAGTLSLGNFRKL